MKNPDRFVERNNLHHHYKTNLRDGPENPCIVQKSKAQNAESDSVGKSTNQRTNYEKRQYFNHALFGNCTDTSKGVTRSATIWP